MKLFKKAPTVEQIHKEFDDAEQLVLEKCNELINSTKYKVEAQLEVKAKMLLDLGFVNAEPVKQLRKLRKNNNHKKNILYLTKAQRDTILQLKQEYPLEKYITVDMLEHICKKYNLIHAPVENYTRDVPEKNVLEMQNARPLHSDHQYYGIKLIGLRSNYLLDLFSKEEPIFTKNDLKRINHHGFEILEKWFDNGDSTWTYAAVAYGIDGIEGKGHKVIEVKDYSFSKIEIIDKTGLFIAAPKSHFNLNGLDKKSKFGFFKPSIIKEVNKDPVVFQYCRNNIVRIITKWGTEDDQSYLDPALTNETFN